MFNTWWKGDTATKYLVGGGMSLRVFSLKFLWDEHRLFRNFWSHTNDGYDLALYYGTKWYLQPHREIDYIFWYDTEVTIYGPQDFLRGHPANLLATKNAIYVRNQKYGLNCRTKKVFIKPPANIPSVWKYQSDWFHIPLFIWGVSLIDWRTWFTKSGGNTIPMHNCTGYPGPNFTTQETTTYSPYIDTGTGNFVEVAWVGPQVKPPPVSGTTWYKVPWAENLPYWLTFYGQNRNMDMNAVPQNILTANPTFVAWLKIAWPKYKEADITSGNFHQEFKVWVIPFQDALNIARIGPFVPSQYQEIVQVPLVYKSFWKWGGTIFHGQPVVKMHGTAPALVSVKNPLVLQRDNIYPWDAPDGILTRRSLQRFLQPSDVPTERKTLPGAEYTSGYEHQETSSETSEETQESETDEDGEEDVGPIIHHIKKRLKREQLKRRRIQCLIERLVKKPKYEDNMLPE